MPRLRAGLCPGLTENIFEKLKNAGFENVINFTTADPEDITKKSGVSYKDVLAIKRVLLAQFSAVPINGVDLYDDVLSSVAILSTGCESLDELLDGGLYTTEITEIVGGVGCGKTQLCLNAAASVVMGTKQNVVYVDTGSSFDVCRAVEMLESKGLVKEEGIAELLTKIRIVRAFDVFELLTELEGIKHQLTQQSDTFFQAVKLLIVDCVAAVISPVLGGQQREGQAYLGHVARALKVLAADYSLAVLVVNNLVHGQAGSLKPALGTSWLHVPNVRLQIDREDVVKASGWDHPRVAVASQGSSRVATLLKSGRQVVGHSVQFNITESGLQAVKVQGQS